MKYVYLVVIFDETPIVKIRWEEELGIKCFENAIEEYEDSSEVSMIYLLRNKVNIDNDFIFNIRGEESINGEILRVYSPDM